ncbi:hypothetical protein [Amycolatopsis sp. NPDC051903]|uniref:hypothetical protein n=1 Tax=Amycolatopsis sp. NPDC051903 TaxID=3363936 RepID=UPI0037B12572
MSDDYCKHDLVVTSCAYCKPPPPGVSPSGWRTSTGTAYHNSPDCPLLLRGQRYAASRGNDTHAPTPIHWSDVVPGTLAPCEHCCTPTTFRPCYVLDGTSWLPGRLSWEPKPRPDGLWHARVLYTRDGEQMDTIRNQHDVRPR